MWLSILATENTSNHSNKIININQLSKKNHMIKLSSDCFLPKNKNNFLKTFTLLFKETFHVVRARNHSTFSENRFHFLPTEATVVTYSLFESIDEQSNRSQSCF